MWFLSCKSMNDYYHLPSGRTLLPLYHKKLKTEICSSVIAKGTEMCNKKCNRTRMRHQTVIYCDLLVLICMGLSIYIFHLIQYLLNEQFFYLLYIYIYISWTASTIFKIQRFFPACNMHWVSGRKIRWNYNNFLEKSSVI